MPAPGGTGLPWCISHSHRDHREGLWGDVVAPTGCPEGDLCPSSQRTTARAGQSWPQGSAVTAPRGTTPPSHTKWDGDGAVGQHRASLPSRSPQELPEPRSPSAGTSRTTPPGDCGDVSAVRPRDGNER